MSTQTKAPGRATRGFETGTEVTASLVSSIMPQTDDYKKLVDPGVVAVWKSDYFNADEEHLLAARHEWQWALTLACVDDRYPPDINRNSAVLAASVIQAIDEVMLWRRRRGVSKPASDLGWPKDWITDLKSRIRLEDHVAQHVQLTRRGRALMATCPFHHPDKTPSLAVWPDTQRFRCFGCGVNGDVIAWEQAMHQLTFREAVGYLAAIAGVDLPESKQSPRQRGALRVA